MKYNLHLLKHFEIFERHNLPLVGDFMSFREIIDALNRQGHNFSFNQVPKEVYAGLFAGAAEIAGMFNYFQAPPFISSFYRHFAHYWFA